MSFPRHAKYKDSGVDWLGQIPGHWAVKRLRFVAELNPSKSEVSHLAAETEVSFLPMEAIGEDGSLELDRVRPLADVQTGYTFFRDGDVTIAKITPCFENGKGAAMRDLCNGIGFGTTELIVIRPKATQTTSNYLHWLFTSRPFRKAGEAFMYGAGGQKRVPDDFVRDFEIGYPPLPEQWLIDTFLEREAKKIDALVQEQTRLIDLLKEKRQAVISRAVTKGLNPNVPMKDSGVEWLGKVPAHWELVALKRLGSIRYGIGEPPKYQPEGVPLIRATNVHAGKLFDDGLVFVDPDDIPAQRIVWLAAGDIIVVRSGAYTGDSAIIPEAYGRCIAGFDMVFRCSNVIPQFLQFALLSSYLKCFQIDLLKLRAAQPHLNAEELGACLVVVPPDADQADIVRFLLDQLSRIDALIAEAEVGVEILQERRAALISAAVTGKIDVRSLVPQPEAVAA